MLIGYKYKPKFELNCTDMTATHKIMSETDQSIAVFGSYDIVKHVYDPHSCSRTTTTTTNLLQQVLVFMILFLLLLFVVLFDVTAYEYQCGL